MKKLLMGLVASLMALSSMAKSPTPWYGWMVFDVQAQAKYADTDKNDNGVIRSETIKALLVVYGDNLDGNGMIVYLDDKDYYLDCSSVSINVPGIPKVKTAKSGDYTVPVGGSTVVAVHVDSDYWNTSLLGTGTWAGKYFKNSNELESQSATLTLTGAAIAGTYGYGSDTARYNQSVSDAMNTTEGLPESVLAAYIAKCAKIPATYIGDITGDLSDYGCVFSTPGLE